MDYYSIKDNRDIYFQDYEKRWTDGAALNFNLDIVKYFHWKNKVYENSADQQVRQVGWQWDLALDLGQYVNLFYYHHSTHLEDKEMTEYKYPMQNYYGVRFYFIRR